MIKRVVFPLILALSALPAAAMAVLENEGKVFDRDDIRNIHLPHINVPNFRVSGSGGLGDPAEQVQKHKKQKPLMKDARGDLHD